MLHADSAHAVSCALCLYRAGVAAEDFFVVLMCVVIHVRIVLRALAMQGLCCFRLAARMLS